MGLLGTKMEIPVHHSVDISLAPASSRDDIGTRCFSRSPIVRSSGEWHRLADCLFLSFQPARILYTLWLAVSFAAKLYCVAASVVSLTLLYIWRLWT